MQHICDGTRLRFILVGRTPQFLPRPVDGSVSSQTGILSQRRESSEVPVREMWAFHTGVCVDDFLVLTRSSGVDGIAVFKSGGRLPCFASSRSLVPRHIFLCETLLYSFCFPIIVSDSPPVLYHPSTKLAKHGLCSDDGDLP